MIDPPLMRAGRTEEASALAQTLGKDIARRSKTNLSHISPKTSVKDLWVAVRQMTGRKKARNNSRIAKSTLRGYFN